ncbi:MAG: hypothetical protein JSS86_13660, partial [Cyanobacteria bacterium SZAS LIN-2]|nr:hypothetical protein [Cyanobacteria bacterium SZAS LIN-2]
MFVFAPESECQNTFVSHFYKGALLYSMVCHRYKFNGQGIDPAAGQFDSGRDPSSQDKFTRLIYKAGIAGAVISHSIDAKFCLTVS